MSRIEIGNKFKPCPTLLMMQKDFMLSAPLRPGDADMLSV